VKELVEKVLPYLPRYLRDLGAVLAGPRRFIARKKVATDEAFVESLVFVAISIALTVALTTPLYPAKDLWMRMASWGVGCLLGGALFSLALRVAWRSVGGHAPVRSFFVAYAYLYGAACVLWALVLLMFAGAFRTFEPALYARFVELIGQPLGRDIVSRPLLPPDLTRDAALRVLSIMSIMIVGQIGLLVWSLAAWSAFRQLNGVSGWRSLAALAIASVLAVPILAVLVFVTNAIG
jgi:hypothetical protein